MTNSKKTELVLGLTAVELSLALDDLLAESARRGAAQIAAMSDDDIEQLIAKSARPAARRGRQQRFIVPIWRAVLDALVLPLNPVTVEALAGEHSGARRAGFKIDLRNLFGDRLDQEDFAWTSGLLRVEAVYSSPETISSLRISIGRRRPIHEGGRPVLVELTDLAHRHEAVILSVDSPSITLPEPPLSGTLENWTLTISAAEPPSP